MAEENIYRSLAHFFESGVVTVNPWFTDLKGAEENLFFKKGDYLYGLYFKSDRKGDEVRARRGLQWCGEMDFVGFAINGLTDRLLPTSRKGKMIVVKREKEWRERGREMHASYSGTIPRGIGVYLAEPNSPVRLFSRKEDSERIAGKWAEGGKIPGECKRLFEGEGEIPERIYYFLGIQALKLGDNRGFGEKLGKMVKEIRDERKRIWKAGIGVESLERIVRAVAERPEHQKHDVPPRLKSRGLKRHSCFGCSRNNHTLKGVVFCQVP